MTETGLLRTQRKNIEIESFALNGVDDITEVTSCSATVNGLKVDAQWTVKNGDGKTGDIDVYLTKDKDILDKIKTSNNNGDSWELIFSI